MKAKGQTQYDRAIERHLQLHGRTGCWDGNIAMMLSNEEDRERYMEWTVSMAPPFSDAAKIAIREAADEYWAEQDRRGTD